MWNIFFRKVIFTMSKAAVVYWSGMGNTEMMAGAVLACDFVICNNAPDDAAVTACKGLGKALT